MVKDICKQIENQIENVKGPLFVYDLMYNSTENMQITVISFLY